jgi:hypothetical protein
MRETRCMSLLPRTTLHRDSEHLLTRRLFYNRAVHRSSVCDMFNGKPKLFCINITIVFGLWTADENLYIHLRFPADLLT